MPAICPSCKNDFKKERFLLSHQRQNRTCSWLLREQEKPLPPPLRHLDDASDGEEDPHFPSDDPMDLDEDFPFRSPNTPSPPPLLEPQSSTRKARHNAKRRVTYRTKRKTSRKDGHPERVEDALEEEVLICDKYEGAAAVCGRENTTFKEFYAATNRANPYRPFKSRLDWEIAQWAKESKVGDNALTRLLKVPGVRVYFSTSDFFSFLIVGH